MKRLITVFVILALLIFSNGASAESFKTGHKLSGELIEASAQVKGKLNAYFLNTDKRLHQIFARLRHRPLEFFYSKNNKKVALKGAIVDNWTLMPTGHELIVVQHEKSLTNLQTMSLKMVSSPSLGQNIMLINLNNFLNRNVEVTFTNSNEKLEQFSGKIVKHWVLKDGDTMLMLSNAKISKSIPLSAIRLFKSGAEKEQKNEE